jgi:riboflavin kinase / FMN adenylyltransferase
MRIIHDLAHIHSTSRSYVTVGVFDGVHRAHQRLINRMVEAAHSTGNAAAAITFTPHPAVVLSSEPLPLLTSVEERIELLAALGLDTLVIFPFTEATARIPATDFAERLLRHLRLAELWIGPDFAFGHRREGDIPFLRRLGAERGFSVHVVEALMWNGKAIRSSRVREALKTGDIPEATGCLGRPYRLSGVVIQGREVGRSMGIPTANLSIPPDRLIPAKGVYACLAHTEQPGQSYPAVVNVGTRPTFNEQTLAVEAHLLDLCDGDLYGRVLALDVIARLRGERAFPTPDALIAQIQQDIAHARIILSR